MNNEDPQMLEAELHSMESRREECLRLKKEVPALAELAELRQTLKKQMAYRESLGFFHRADRKRIDEQIRRKQEEIEQHKILVELQQEGYDEEIVNLNIAIAAIQTEIERRQAQAE